MVRASYQRDRGVQSCNARSKQRAREEHASLRERGLVKASIGGGVARKVADEHPSYDVDGLAAYGLYSPYSGKWVLTAMAAARWNSTSDDKCEYKAVTTDDPEHGVEIATAGSKAELLDKIDADTSEKIEAGKYVVRPSEDTRYMPSETVDKGEYFDMHAATVR